MLRIIKHLIALYSYWYRTFLLIIKYLAFFTQSMCVYAKQFILKSNIFKFTWILGASIA